MLRQIVDLKKKIETRYQLEVIVIDNNSDDNSITVAKKHHTKVFKHTTRGYGSTVSYGLKKANGKYCIVMDSDNSYAITQIPDAIHLLDKGYDYVLGSRMAGKIDVGAMPLLHRYLGNPLLTMTTNILYGCKLTDSQTGFRGMRNHLVKRCTFSSTGMEFASELTIEMIKQNATIAEFPANYKRRIGTSKLSPVADGLKHLFLLLKRSIG